MNAAHNRTTFDPVDIRHDPRRTRHEREDDENREPADNNNNNNNLSQSMQRRSYREESAPAAAATMASAAIMADNAFTNDLMGTIDQARRQHKLRPTAEQCREAEAAVLSHYYDLPRIRELIERNGIDVNKIISVTTGKTLLHTAMTFVPPPGNRLVVEIPVAEDGEVDGCGASYRKNKVLGKDSRQAHVQRENDHGHDRPERDEGEPTSFFSVRRFFENYHVNDDPENTTPANSENHATAASAQTSSAYNLLVSHQQPPPPPHRRRPHRRHLAFTISNNNDITHKFIAQYDNDPQLKLVKYLIEELGADPLLTFANDRHSPFDAACFDGTAPLMQYLIDRCGINIAPPNSADIKYDDIIIIRDDDGGDSSRYLRIGDEREDEIGQCARFHQAAPQPSSFSSYEFEYIDHSSLVARSDNARIVIGTKKRSKKKQDGTTSTTHHNSEKEKGFSSEIRGGEGTEEVEEEDEIGARYVSQICVNAASAPLYALPTFMASHDDTVTILFTLLSNGAAVGEADCPHVRYRSRYAAARPRVAAKLNASDSDAIHKDLVPKKSSVMNETQGEPEGGIFSKVKGFFSRLVATSTPSKTEASRPMAVYERHYFDPLFGAAVNGSIWCVWLLLSHGADLTPSLFRECMAMLRPPENLDNPSSGTNNEIEDNVVKNFPLHPCPPHPSSEVYRHLSRTQTRAIVKKLLLENFCGE